MKRNVIRSVILAVICIVLLASCVTKSPIGDREYFQGLGLDGDFVITVNADLLDVSEYVQSEDKAVTYIAERMTRLSLALVDRRTDVPPLTTEFTEFDYYGAIEGDFSKKLINGALSLSSVFTSEKDKATKLKFFVDNVLSSHASDEALHRSVCPVVPVLDHVVFDQVADGIRKLVGALETPQDKSRHLGAFDI